MNQAVAAVNSLYRQFDTDPELEKKGVRVEYTTGDEETDKTPPTFLVARAGGANAGYNMAVDQKLKPLRRRLAADNVGLEELEQLTREAYAAHVIKGWWNVVDRSGNEIVYSPAAAVKLFKDLPELYEDLKQQASKITLYRRAAIEEIAKNS